MSIQTVLIAARQAAEKLMRSQIRITRVDGEPRFDPETLKPVTPKSMLVYEGKGRIQSYEAYGVQIERADASITTTNLRCDIPVGTAKVKPGDIVEVLSNLDDPLLAGLKAVVVGVVPFKSQATAYRMLISEVER